MIARNVEAIIGHCLKSIVPFVDEVVVVDTGSTDKTKETILGCCPHAKILDYTPETHPNGFLLDVAETWKEKLPGPWSGKHMLANFGEARQIALDACTSDYAIWMDSDDVLTNGDKLRDVVASMKKEGYEAAMVKYDYETDDDGNVVMTLIRERIIRRRKEIVWCQPIHEVICPTFHQVAVNDIVITHRRRQYGLQPEFHLRNLKVLLHWFEGKKEEDVDPRMLFYLAMEETWLRPEEALRHYALYCEKSGSEAERAKAHVYAGRIHEMKKPPALGAAFAEYAQATLDAPYDPDPFFNAARVAYFMKRYSKCIELTEKGFAATKDTSGRVNIFQFNPLERSYQPHVYYAFSLHTEGRLKEALDVCNEGLKWCPTEPHLLGTKEVLEHYFEDQKKKEEQPVNPGTISLAVHRAEPLEEYPKEVPTDVTSYFAMLFWKKILVHGGGVGYVQAEKFLQILPEGILFNSKKQEMLDFLREKRKILLPSEKVESKDEIDTSEIKQWFSSMGAYNRLPVAQGKLDIVFHLGPSWERWSPKTVETTGIGGSEIAVINMAKELVARGHRVTVLNDCAELAGIYDGVYYIDYQRAANEIERYACDVFISSRQPHILDLPWKYKLSILWVHDTHVGQPSTTLSGQLFHYDRFFCLSAWHKKFFNETYPFLHESSILQTRNGIDTKRFSAGLFKEIPKEGNRLIYSSSPDRGLETLLKLMPAIRAIVPDVQLHIYYGFANWRKMAESSKRTDWLDLISKFESILDEGHRRGELVFHGRVNQDELAKAFMASKVWAYPTWFHETSCVTAMEAQAAGCVPVTTSLAALRETVKYGVLINPPNDTEAYSRSFVDSVVDLLTDDSYDSHSSFTTRRSLAIPAREHAMKNLSWSQVADDWLKIFEEALAQKSESPLPAFGDF